MALHKQKNEERRSFFGVLKKHRVKLCAAFLALVLSVSAALYMLGDEVAYAAEPVLWGHKGKGNVTVLSDGEIARFYDGTEGTLPAEYSDAAWGNFTLGGINRVTKDALLTTRPQKGSMEGSVSGIAGVNAVDTYSEYITKNVSVVRYKGGKDSNLGISVNNESVGYMKMNVSGASGRYLYYSVSVESLTGSAGSNYGTFAVGIGNSSGIVVRTEKNKCGGAAFLSGSNAYTTYTDSTNWIDGYEYGCIDLMALTGNSSESVSEVYLFGTAKTKIVINYLIASDDAPTKIDVANGNILHVGGVANAATSGVTRTYSNKNGYQGTAKMNITSTKWFGFENLVVDTEYTPYLYYSFTVTAAKDESPALAYWLGDSKNYVAERKNVANGEKLVSVTGCVNLATVVGKDGIINISSNDDRGVGFDIGAGKNLVVNYLFISSGIDVSVGEHVIVKNADATNIYNANGTYRNYTVEDFSYGSLPVSYTYASKGVYALYETEISSKIPLDFCWYVNTSGTRLNAKKLGVANVTNGNIKTTINGVEVNASVTVGLNGRKTVSTLKVNNPTKKHQGLYFFCLVVSRNNQGSYVFKDTLDQTALNALDNRLSLSTNYCRLDVADNIVYHKVNQNGVEMGICGEEWIVYGTSSKITADFEPNGDYIRYDRFTAEAGVGNKYEKLQGNKYVEITEADYKLMDYDYSKVNSSVQGVVFNGWMLFEGTIKNPNVSAGVNNYDALNAYKAVYRPYYNSITSIKYNDEVAHRYWTFPKQYLFEMNGDTASKLHDTTINLYSGWEIPVEAYDLKIDIFVDEFGTTFMAKETGDGKFISATKGENGENDFINDKVYVAVAPKNDGSSVTISGGNGTLQYSVDNGATWVEIDGDASLIKTIFTKESNTSNAKKWYQQNTEYSYDIVYAMYMDTDDLLKAFGKTDGNSGPRSEFKITFRYIAGVADSGSWFNFTGKAVCGSIRFVPFSYAEME